MSELTSEATRHNRPSSLGTAGFVVGICEALQPSYLLAVTDKSQQAPPIQTCLYTVQTSGTAVSCRRAYTLHEPGTQSL